MSPPAARQRPACNRPPAQQVVPPRGWRSKHPVQLELHDSGQGPTAPSHCHFATPLIHFIPSTLTYSVPLSLQRQCDRTLGQGGGWRRLVGGRAGMAVDQVRPARRLVQREQEAGIPGRHCHPTRSLTVIDCHSLGICTAVLLPFCHFLMKSQWRPRLGRVGL